MQTQLRRSVVCLILIGTAAIAAAGDNVQQVLARMDKASADFKAMTAHVTYLTHTDVLNQDDTETGSATMKKVQSGEVQGLVDFTAPDRKTITYEKRRVQEYLPRIKTLQVYDLEKQGERLDRFLRLGFGTSGSELAKDYDVTVLGSENGAAHLQLVPKDVDTRHYVKKIDLWIPEQGDPYPMREKILEPSGDYFLVTYSDLKINPPLAPDALQLKLPPGVKTEHPGQ
jgi:outer membrane lipoprotein-sorting protein